MRRVCSGAASRLLLRRSTKRALRLRLQMRHRADADADTAAGSAPRCLLLHLCVCVGVGELSRVESSRVGALRLLGTWRLQAELTQSCACASPRLSSLSCSCRRQFNSIEANRIESNHIESHRIESNRITSKERGSARQCHHAAGSTATSGGSGRAHIIAHCSWQLEAARGFSHGDSCRSSEEAMASIRSCDDAST